MRRLLSLLVIVCATSAMLGCTTEPAAPPTTPDTNTDLGSPGAIDEGEIDTTGSTTY